MNIEQELLVEMVKNDIKDDSELAKVAGLTRMTIINIMKGKNASHRTIIKLSKALNLSPKRIIEIFYKEDL